MLSWRGVVFARVSFGCSRVQASAASGIGNIQRMAAGQMLGFLMHCRLAGVSARVLNRVKNLQFSGGGGLPFLPLYIPLSLLTKLKKK